MNDIKRTALKETVKTLVGLTALGLAVPAILFNVPMPIIGIVLAVGVLVYAAKMIYDTKLSQAKFDAEMNKNG
jgi:hypothetical protein